MVWQKILAHLNGPMVRVESKDGNKYVAEAEYDHIGNDIYELLVNRANDDNTYWAWVEFEDNDAIVKDYKCGDRPKKPPGEHP